jgi:cobalt-zinc-cadmium efflux system outer membrane protein
MPAAVFLLTSAQGPSARAQGKPRTEPRTEARARTNAPPTRRPGVDVQGGCPIPPRPEKARFFGAHSQSPRFAPLQGKAPIGRFSPFRSYVTPERYRPGDGDGDADADADGSQVKALTLKDALALARKNNRTLRVARARIGEAQGDLIQASVWLVSNPELGVSGGPRFMTASRGRVTPDLDVHLEQSLELAGQRGHRRSRARARVRTARASVANTRRVIELAVALLYYRALAARERLDLLRENVALATALRQTARDRADLGAGTALDLNASRLRVAEAKRRVLAAVTARQGQLLRLARVCGLPAGTTLRLRGALPDPQRVPSRATLSRRALRARPELETLRHRMEAARAAVRLSDARGWPDLRLGVGYAREEGSNVVIFSLKVDLPLFHRNQGRRHRARVRLQRLRSQRSGAALSVSTDVRLAWAAHRRAARALSLYSQEVLSAQKASLRLLQRAHQEGKVDQTKVLVVQRELVTGREGYLEARLAYAEALARLRAAACLPQGEHPTRRKN